MQFVENKVENVHLSFYFHNNDDIKSDSFIMLFNNSIFKMHVHVQQNQTFPMPSDTGTGYVQHSQFYKTNSLAYKSITWVHHAQGSSESNESSFNFIILLRTRIIFEYDVGANTEKYCICVLVLNSGLTQCSKGDK